jgi:hypothetical protein
MGGVTGRGPQAAQRAAAVLAGGERGFDGRGGVPPLAR